MAARPDTDAAPLQTMVTWVSFVHMWERHVSNVLIALMPLTLLNFAAFIVITLYLGGDAVNGQIVSGHYYVGNHGIYTEVSFGVFLYSKIHAYFTIITFTLMMALMLLIALKGKKELPGGPA